MFFDKTADVFVVSFEKKDFKLKSGSKVIER